MMQSHVINLVKETNRFPVQLQCILLLSCAHCEFNVSKCIHNVSALHSSNEAAKGPCMLYYTCVPPTVFILYYMYVPCSMFTIVTPGSFVPLSLSAQKVNGRGQSGRERPTTHAKFHGTRTWACGTRQQHGLMALQPLQPSKPWSVYFLGQWFTYMCDDK